MKSENLTAWALNELSAEEQAQLEAELQADPAAQEAAASNKEFCGFLTRELRDESLALTPEQRALLFKTPVHKVLSAASAFEPKPLRWWQRPAIPMAAAAAVIVMGALAAYYLNDSAEKVEPAVAESKYKLEEIRVAASPKPSSSAIPKSIGAPPAPSSLLNRTAAAASSRIVSMSAADAPADLLATGVTAEKIAALKDTSLGQNRVAATQQAGQAAVNWAEQSPASPMPMLASAPSASSAGVSGMGGIQKIGAGNMTLNGGSTYAGQSTLTLGGNLTFTGNNTYTGGTTIAGSGGMIISNPEPEALTGMVAAGGKVIHLERSGQTAVLFPNQEDYAKFVENPLTSVAREPLSTFSTDVDTASYANVRRFLNINARPPRDAVRIEELINYFPSSEPAPAADSKQPFAVTVEMAACPWQPQHRLTRINLKGRDMPAGEKPSNLVFLVDVSGSMDHPEKLPLVQRSLRMLTERLGENDHVAMVTYAGGTRVVLPSTNGVKKADIIAAIDQLTAGGSTHGSAGIKLAYEQAVSGFIQGGVNRVILCTDGDFNVGLSSPQELEGFITEKARSGVFLSVLGFGTGNLKDRTMQTLADKGNGNHAYIDSVSEARKVLVEQMQGTLVTIAKDVKIQVEFNPAIIREYRLIGYEKRLLAKEDFNDDTKDAGEIGAGHSVTALYELVPANLPPGTTPAPLVDKLKYQTDSVQLAAPAPVKTLNAGSNEALTVKLRYKEPEGTTSKLIEVPVNDDARALEKASAEFKFTAAVAGFGMLMRESSYSGSLTWDRVRTLAREGKGSDALGYRGEFLQLIEKAAAGK
ncbi:MAG: von Willebrand factor type A domain-containing protein [Verrucomicrobiota bacterium]